MKTIEKILKYNLSEEDIKILKELGFINGCGAKGSFNFSDFLQKNISEFKNFLPNKNFFQDVEKICNEHDLDFMFFREKTLGFIRANFSFCWKIFKLLHWASFSERFWITIILFFGITKFGKSAFRNSLSINLDILSLILYFKK